MLQNSVKFILPNCCNLVEQDEIGGVSRKRRFFRQARKASTGVGCRQTLFSGMVGNCPQTVLLTGQNLHEKPYRIEELIEDLDRSVFRRNFRQLRLTTPPGSN